MKTKEELNALKEEVEALSDKLSELTEDELEQVTGGKAQHVIDCSVLPPACKGRTSEIEKCPRHGTSDCPWGY